MIKVLKGKNYYELLGVPSNANMHEIQKAYKVSKETFQDNSLATYSLFAPEETRQIFELISEAFHTLSDPKLRQVYDFKLFNNNKPTNSQKAASPAHPRQSKYHLSNTAKHNGHLPGELSPKRVSPASHPTGNISLQDHAARIAAQNHADKSQNIKKIVNLKKLVAPGKKFDGATLRCAREACGYSLASLAEETKIRYTYLDCLEKEDFRTLPSRIYVRGFISLICETLNLPSQQICQDYMDIYDKHASS